MKIFMPRLPRAIALAAVLAAAAAVPASATIGVTQISADPFTNTTSQHATEVEPDTFAFGIDGLAAFQVGRFFNGGASDIGFARSSDGGATWDALGLPAGPDAAPGRSPTEPVRARERRERRLRRQAHATWMISSIPLLPGTSTCRPSSSAARPTAARRSATRSQIPPPAPNKVDLDKNWTVCDNHPASPFYGHCYTEFDNFGEGDLEYMSTSTDGGQTWSAPVSPAGKPKGLGGQPVVQPDGTVIVPFESLHGTIAAFSSTDGGATWSQRVAVSTAQLPPRRRRPAHEPAARAPRSTAPARSTWPGRTAASSEVHGQRHRLQPAPPTARTGAPSARIPIDAGRQRRRPLHPGLAVDPATSGAGAHLALTYYFYPDAACTPATCQLDAGYASSPDGGATGARRRSWPGRCRSTDIADTSQGPMVGDYISTSFTRRPRATVIAIGKRATGNNVVRRGHVGPDHADQRVRRRHAVSRRPEAPPLHRPGHRRDAPRTPRRLDDPAAQLQGQSLELRHKVPCSSGSVTV